MDIRSDVEIIQISSIVILKKQNHVILKLQCKKIYCNKEYSDSAMSTAFLISSSVNGF